MAKPALGRGLGNLLGDTQIANKPEPATAPPDTASPTVSPGLGNLLAAGRNGGGEKPPTAPETLSKATPTDGGPEPAAGLQPEMPRPRPLMKPAPQTEWPEEPPVRAPRWTLIGADLLLIALAALLVFKSPTPLKPWEMTLCLAAVMMGAILACVAILTPPRQ